MGSQVNSACALPEGASGVTEVLDSLRYLVRELRVGASDAQRLHGLSAAQVFVLQQLAGAPPLSLGDLAQRTHTDPSSVSAVVQRLVDKRLITRRRARDDARRAVITLSAKGREVIATAPPAVQNRIIDALNALPEATREELTRGLRALVVAMGGGADAPPLFFEEPEAKRADPEGE